MEKTIDVLTFGDLCVDLIVKGSDIVPEFGQKEKMVEDYSLELGGSCSIFACQCSKLGLNTMVVGKVGKDVFGDLIYNTMISAGIDTSLVLIDNCSKTGITVQLDKTDDRAMLTYNGTIDSFEIGDITDELLMKVKHLHIGSYFLMKKIQPHYPEILKKLKAFGATISLDTNWDPEENWDSGLKDIIQYVDIFLPNENEAMAVTGLNSLTSAIETLKSQIPVIALKKGREGGSVYAGEKASSTGAIDVSKKDSIGAGDSFDGGFVYGFLNGLSLEKCLQIGCICGSMNTRAVGGTMGQARLDEVMKYISE
jgi:sugar/nucleoside kinase (ribokinase family)